MLSRQTILTLSVSAMSLVCFSQNTLAQVIESDWSWENKLTQVEQKNLEPTGRHQDAKNLQISLKITNEEDESEMATSLNLSGRSAKLEVGGTNISFCLDENSLIQNEVPNIRSTGNSCEVPFLIYENNTSPMFVKFMAQTSQNRFANQAECRRFYNILKSESKIQKCK